MKIGRCPDIGIMLPDMKTGCCHDDDIRTREEGEDMPRYKAALFDLDGTISDSGPGIMNSVRYALERMEMAPLPEETLRRFVGPSLLYSFVTYAGMTEEEGWKAIDYYRERYLGGEVFNLTIYEGLPQLLELLGRNGVLCAVVTAKPQAMAQKILERFDLEKYFVSLTGPDMDGLTNEKVDLIRRALARLGLENRDAVMIGDTRFDIIGAKNAGCDSIGVTYGYGTREELEENGADHLAGSPAQIAPLVLGS